jgi:cobalt/nickel transport system ATP-binding protein
LRQIHTMGTTIVMATHDLDLAYCWADWIFILNQGQLVLEGTPQDVFAQRDILERLHLEVPLVFDVLDKVSEALSTNLQQTDYQVMDSIPTRVEKILRTTERVQTKQNLSALS